MNFLSRLLGSRPPGTAQGEPDRSPVPEATRVVWSAASVLLQYPSDAQRAALPTVLAALAEVDASGVRPRAADASVPDRSGIAVLVDHLLRTPAARLEAEFVQEFDLSRRHSLHLTYWTDGDTRRRGEALSLIKGVYRAYGAEFDESELPDHLGMLLEFSARIAPDDGYQLLQRYRPSLELLRLALVDAELPWASAVALVCDTLPGPSPASRDKAMALAGYGADRTEQVGLEPPATRLLPLRTVAH